MKGNKRLVLIIILVVLIIALGIIGGLAYAKYVRSMSGSISASVANVVCNMEVLSSSEDGNGDAISPADKTVINPYCIIAVKNYTGQDISNPDSLTQCEVDYTVSVKPVLDAQDEPTFSLPVCRWYEISSPNATSGTLVATSVAGTSESSITGSIGNSQGQVRYYKVVFSNSGEDDVTQYVDFFLNVEQHK